ncbi:hypothetical protein Glove_634g10 [Diversispora epigaea]|uniref:Pre-rRNA-processing protein n=1 Tax=Diversispora epigaea TaxID=1348612 RepID=A0A397G9N2_9GLOM|nr:hypothetical protein Glove_634g10 [Diversispora epigaea]
MPKKSQRKKKIKQEDFKKSKLKVGKKKPKPTNFTDTSFKSKSIILPNQSIIEDKSNEITNSRNLTLNDLTTQLKHYNSGVRKDAIQGLKDFFYKHPHILTESLSVIINSLARLLIDDEKIVRKTLLSFFREFMPNVQKSDLKPFIPLLIIFTCSAMTHIYEDIRADAIKFMEIWTTVAPDVVVNGFWQKVIQNYITLLNSKSNSSSSTSFVSGFIEQSTINAQFQFWSHETKTQILSSFYKLLKIGLTNEGNENNNNWNFLFSVDHSITKPIHDSRQTTLVNWTDLHGEVEISPLHPLTATLLPFLSISYTEYHSTQLKLFNSTSAEINQDNIYLGKNNNIFDHDSTTLHGRIASAKDILNILHPVLISLWLDTVPSVFGTIDSLTYKMLPALQMIHLILKIMNLLWGSYLSSVIKNQNNKEDKQMIEVNLKQLIKYIVVYFPFGSESEGMLDSKIEPILKETNIIFCEIVTLYMFYTTLSFSSKGNFKLNNNSKDDLIEQKSTQMHNDKKRKQDKDSESNNIWIDQVFNHVLFFLGFERNDKGNEKGNNNTKTLKPDTKPENLRAMLFTIRSLLSCLSQKEREILFEAILDYSRKCHVHSTTKRICINFISEILMSNNYNFIYCNDSLNDMQVDSSLATSLQIWALSLPRLLWELKTNSLETTKVILNVLCGFAKRGSKCIFNEEVFDQLQISLVPYFYEELDDNNNNNNKEPLFGPFTSLPQDLQLQAMEFLYHCPRITDKMKFALNKVFDDKIPLIIKNYVEILSEKFLLN